MTKTTTIDWRMGVEVELMAPPGKSRLDLARAIARSYEAEVERFFHPQSEPSLVPGSSIFHNLTLGFRIAHRKGGWIASCVDDLSLQSDLNREAAPEPGWYRILSDDERLLRLVANHCNAHAPGDQVLNPLANLFSTAAETGPDGMFRVNDSQGSTIAIAAPLPGERERACELVTAPLDSHHQQHLDRLLGAARALGFYAPIEGATHLHFDAMALQSAGAMANLVHLWQTHAPCLKRLVGTNPHCRRLGLWPGELFEVVAAPDFRTLSWPEAQARLKKVPLTKFCDLNLVNCVLALPTRNTVEIRILPVHLESGPLMEAAALFAALLRRARQPEPVFPAPESEDVHCLLDQLSISGKQREQWLDQVLVATKPVELVRNI